MAKIVGVFLMPHDPYVSSKPDAAPPEQAKVVMGAFDTIAQRLTELDVDTIVTISGDHYKMFGPNCIPQCLVGIGDVSGPLEKWLGLERRGIANNEGLAKHILDTGYHDGVDWAFAKSLVVDHAMMIPYHYCVKPNSKIRTVPIYLNVGVMPAIRSRRAREIGQSIRRAVQTWGGSERVAVFGTGGISHWVGMSDMGRVNVEFDKQILDWIREGNLDALVSITDEEIIEQAGNGALEIKHLICAMATLPEARAEIIAYEAVPEWVTGLGFAELKPAA